MKKFLFQKNEFFKWYSDENTESINIPRHTAYLTESLQDEHQWAYVLINNESGIKKNDGSYAGEIIIWEDSFDKFKERINIYSLTL